MANLNCQINIPDAEKGLTVGTVFALDCEGEIPAFQAGASEIRLDAADAYKLKLLDFQKDSSKLKIKVTSYKVGDHQLKAVQMLDSEHSAVLGDLQFSVKSVLDPNEPRSEAFGPMGPVVLGFPYWFWLLIALFFAFVFGTAYRIWSLKTRRKKWLASMKLQESPLGSIALLGKTLRAYQRDLGGALDKKRESVEALRKSFLFFLAQKFQIPTYFLSDANILKEIRVIDPKLFEKNELALKSTFQELQKLLKSAETMSLRDWEQILNLVRKTAEDLEKGL